VNTVAAWDEDDVVGEVGELFFAERVEAARLALSLRPITALG